MKTRIRWTSAFLIILLAAALPVSAHAAATIVIINQNLPGVGFNDPTPVAPVGGNPEMTLGAQRLLAFNTAAAIWGAQIDSAVPITIGSAFVALSCTATSAVLGSAGPTEVWSGSFGAFPSAWYHFALANKLAGVDLDPANPQISARFNSNLGKPGCLTGTSFYLGLDNAHGTAVDLITVLIHEFAHGLGFSTVTSGSSGAFLGGQPAVWDYFVFDITQNKFWVDMTNAERVTSALNTRRVVWTGANVTGGSFLVLASGVPRLSVTAPAGIAGDYLVGVATFGPTVSSPGVSGELMPVVDTSGTGAAGCTPFSSANTLAVAGKIALVDRGVCAFTVKVKNAQNAGAIGVIIGDNFPGSPPSDMGGTDPTVTIPAVRVTLADSNLLKSALQYRSRTHSGVFVNLGTNPTQLRGADGLGRVFLFTPNPLQPGSSVSHWDVSAFPNLLMEPNINGDLTHAVTVPLDLTLPLLHDIGW